MRTLTLLALMVALTFAAQAQVTTSDQSLDTLKQAPPPKPARPAKPKIPAKAETPHARGAAHTRPSPPPAKPKAQKLPQMPPAPPANPVIAPPPITLPTHPPPPPPPVPLSADAPGVASPIPNGTRITFGPQKSDLNPATLAAIKSIAAEALANPAITIGIIAWAPGVADDPSTPRRLSLDRALAARAVMINAGIASERIRTIAKGMNDIGNGPADRADVTKILPPAQKK